MLFNLGSAYCLRSEYDKARKCLHQVRPAKGLQSVGLVAEFEALVSLLKIRILLSQA